MCPVQRPMLFFPCAPQHCFRDPPKTPTLNCPQTWPWEAGGRAASASAAWSRQLQRPLRPERKQAIRWTGDLSGVACRLLGGRQDAGRGHPRLPPEPQGPPCLNTSVLATSLRRPPLFWVPAFAQHGPRRPSLIVTPPTRFPGQSHHRNAILIPQH